MEENLIEKFKIRYKSSFLLISRFEKGFEKYKNTEFYPELEREFKEVKKMGDFASFFTKLKGEVENRWKGT